MDDAEFTRLYGDWKPRIPDDVKEFFGGYSGAWWIADGWSLQAFTGVERHHGDIDPGILRAELPLLRAHARGRLDLWAAFSGALKPGHPTILTNCRTDAVSYGRAVAPPTLGSTTFCSALARPTSGSTGATPASGCR